MPVGRFVQASFNSGEFDPNLWGREDVTFFYSSARRLENVLPLPQGGARRRDGMVTKSAIRGQVSQGVWTGATLTAPNGGTPGNATDGDTATLVTTTTAIGTTNPYEIIRVDWGATGPYADPFAVDISDLSFSALPSGTEREAVELQTSDDAAAWTSVATITVGITAYNRRFAAKPTATLGAHRYWRLVRTGATSLPAATVSLSEMSFWTEDTGTLTESVSHRITIGIGTEYLLIFVDKCCDVFDGDTGAWVASMATPHTAAQLREMTTNARLATMILYHKDVPPQIVQNLGAANDWRSGAVSFDSVSEYVFEDDLDAGGVNEKQYADFGSMTPGDKYQFELNGEMSAIKTWVGSGGDGTSIATTLGGLTDITSVMVAYDSGDNYFIEFTGVDGLQPWPIMVVSILTGSGTGIVTRVQAGKVPFGDLWSATRGYPRCGTFYQGRHWMGGFLGAPDVVAGSRAGILFDFKNDAAPVATSPIVARADVDEQVTVLHIFAGRHLQIFTSSLELYVPTEPIMATNIALKVTSRIGSEAEVAPFDVQGGTFFVAKGGRSVREFLFVDTQQSYSAQPVSRLSGHLVSSPRAMVVQRHANTDQPNVVMLANTGTDDYGNTVPPAVATVDRNQQVTAFARLATLGVIKHFATTQAGKAFAVVSRTFNSVTWDYLEEMDGNYYLDASAKITNGNIDDFTATASQTVFTYTFASPASAADVAVWARLTAADDWVREDAAGYAVDLVGKTVTFSTGRAVGELIRINERLGVVDLTGAGSHLASTPGVFVSGDGLPLGTYTAGASSVSLGASRYDFSAEVGFSFAPKVILHPYKAAGQTSPTMKRQRIFRVISDWRQTLSATITFEGDPDLNVLTPYTSAIAAGGVLSYTEGGYLTDGPKRMSGIGCWLLDPHLVISQSEPGAWHLRSLTYDVRF